MQSFVTLTGVAAPLPLDNIDTGMICPSAFMKVVSRDGLGQYLFHDMRHDGAGKPHAGFVLNKPAYAAASILITGTNFGCGSSREHAVWAIREFGIRCIIAESFADIFATNASRNGMLLITLPRNEIDSLVADAEKGSNARLTIDLATQLITRPDGTIMEFEIDAFRKHCLLNGVSHTDLLDQRKSTITSFEHEHRRAQPWLWDSPR
ncbi:MAG: 3-isopropylmalate dehydratase small subunit [Pseudorhodoplanes sp.]|nr:3-isopropylmalate dehydratase small subunit [Pseudorhodoplanes sp.]